MKPGRGILFPAGIAVLTVTYLALAVFLPETINHTPEYSWPVLHHGMGLKTVFAAAALVSIIWLVVSFGRSMERDDKPEPSHAATLIFIFVCAIALQIIPMSAHRMGLLEFPLRIYLPDHTSYFSDACDIDNTQDLLDVYPDRVMQLGTHSRTHPPLPVLGFHALNRAAEGMPWFVSWFTGAVPESADAQRKFDITASQAAAGFISAWLIVLIAGLCAVLAYSVALMFLPKRAAYIAGMIFIFTPAFSHHTPVMDQVFAFFILVMILFLLKSLQRKSLALGLAAGVFMGAGLWASPAFIAAGVLGGAVALAWILSRGREGETPVSIRFTFVIICFFTAGVSAGLLGTGGMLDLSYIEVYRANMQGWLFNNTVSGRIHKWMWMLFNPYEFFAWQGVPVAVLFLAGMVKTVRSTLQKTLSPEVWLFWAVFGFMLAIDLSGKICYESSRLMWFLVPFTCMLAAGQLNRLAGARIRAAFGLIFSLQAVSVLAFRLVF